ncbi:MAG TPA: hypothetical protein VED46_01835 [Alphaproteobacteria bacterium]|nr:hypothetical protein [Alphaproteobacteria bacterium]
MRHPTIPAAGALLLSACIGAQPEPIARPVPLVLPSFTVTAPAAPAWILTPGTARTQAAVRPIGESRTVVAFAGEEELTKPAENVEAELDRAVDEIRAGYDGGRHRLYAFSEAPDAPNCRNYRLTAEDSGVPDRQGRIYLVTALGRVCLYPELALLARLEYSDRRLPDEPPLPSFDEEAEAFLGSLSVGQR